MPSVHEIISELNKYKLDIMLIGSEAGKIYKLCDSTKDIDFIVHPSKENTIKLFSYLQHNFEFNDMFEFNALEQIVLRNIENKNIELIKNPFCLSIMFNIQNYDTLKQNAKKIKYYDTYTDIISLEDYIDSIKRSIDYPCYRDNPEFNNKMLKYNTILDNFNRGKYEIIWTNHYWSATIFWCFW